MILKMDRIFKLIETLVERWTKIIYFAIGIVMG